MLEFLLYMVALTTWFVIGWTVGYRDDNIDNSTSGIYLFLHQQSRGNYAIWIYFLYRHYDVGQPMWNWYRSDAVLLSVRSVYVYDFYSGNAKLSMPFWFNFDISIPMLAR